MVKHSNQERSIWCLHYKFVLENINNILLSYSIIDCNDFYTINSEWSTGQKGTISFTVPTTSDKCNVRMVFDKSVKDIKVQRGQNEVCYGKVCTFKHRLKGSLSEGQNLKLPLRLGFVETDDHPHVSGIEFNGEKICGIDIPVGNIKTTKQVNCKRLLLHYKYLLGNYFKNIVV